MIPSSSLMSTNTSGCLFISLSFCIWRTCAAETSGTWIGDQLCLPAVCHQSPYSSAGISSWSLHMILRFLYHFSVWCYWLDQTCPPSQINTSNLKPGTQNSVKEEKLCSLLPQLAKIAGYNGDRYSKRRSVLLGNEQRSTVRSVFWRQGEDSYERWKLLCPLKCKFSLNPKVKLKHKVKSVSAGGLFTAVVMDNGAIWTWYLNILHLLSLNCFKGDLQNLEDWVTALLLLLVHLHQWLCLRNTNLSKSLLETGILSNRKSTSNNH